MSETLIELGDYLQLKLGAALREVSVRHGELTLTIDRDQIARVLRVLRDDGRCRFEILIDICGVDYPERAERFDIVYHLLSPRINERIRVKLSTDETTPVALNRHVDAP